MLKRIWIETQLEIGWWIGTMMGMSTCPGGTFWDALKDKKTVKAIARSIMLDK